jgi:predicted negative regulator of RcsB-dependent stress response
VGKRSSRRDQPPPSAGLHEYAERAAEWILRYKFTLVVVVVLVVGAAALTGWRRRGAQAEEVQAWQRMAESQTAAELRLALPELDGTSAYPWAALRLGSYLYRQEEFEEARRVLEPVVSDPELAPYPRGYCFYVLGCIYLEGGRTAQAKIALEKALTEGHESPFLQELVSRVLTALADWPPAGPPEGEAQGAPTGSTSSPEVEAEAEESGSER